MSRTPSRPFLRLTPARLVVAAAVALALVAGLSVLLPDREGGDDRDGAITTVTEQYDATSGVPGPSPITPAARAEIDRVLDAGPDRTLARVGTDRQAAGLLRCATFEEQQYCLGRGWTDAPESELTTEATTVSARTTSGETTGDLTDADLLARRAAMAPAELRAEEREELEDAARSVAKVVLLRHQYLGEPLPDGFLERHPEARAGSTELATSSRTSGDKTMKDYPERATVLRKGRTAEQVRTYWCGPTTMQMSAWGWRGERQRQLHWARRLGTTTNGTGISDMVRVVNDATGYDRRAYAGDYIVLDISRWSYQQWMLLQMRHVKDYRAPLVLHPVLLKRYYPYLDDDASGHFQVGRGYDKNGDRPGDIGYFEPWNQQRFDPSEPYIKRVQWRRAYKSFRANKAHFQQNIGV